MKLTDGCGEVDLVFPRSGDLSGPGELLLETDGETFRDLKLRKLCFLHKKGKLIIYAIINKLGNMTSGPGEAEGRRKKKEKHIIKATLY